MPIRWQVYPASQRPPELAVSIAEVFRQQESIIGTPPNKPQSNTVLEAVSEGLQRIGFSVETSKSRKIKVPVLYGINGKPLKTFEVDAWNPELGAVLEVEAGVAIDARKVYQDLFEAIAMPDVDFFCVAVQNAYHPSRRSTPFDDFDRAKGIFDSLFASGRLELPMRTVMLLGY